jgi:SAM-dependent methyltransferase
MNKIINPFILPLNNQSDYHFNYILHNTLHQYSSSIIPISSFTLEDLYQFCLLYQHLHQTYQIDFHPSHIVCYRTVDPIPHPIINASLPLLLVHFSQTPSYFIPNPLLINNIESKTFGVIYTNPSLSLYNDRLIYMWALFQTRNESRISPLLHTLGEAFQTVFQRASSQNDFSIIEQWTIVSQFPTLHTFFAECIPYLKDTLSQEERDQMLCYVPSHILDISDTMKDEVQQSYLLSSLSQLIQSNQLTPVEDNGYDSEMVEQFISFLNTISDKDIQYWNSYPPYYKFPIQNVEKVNLKQYKIISSVYRFYEFLLMSNNIQHIEYALKLQSVKFIYQSIHKYLFHVLRSLNYQTENKPITQLTYCPTYSLSQFYFCTLYCKESLQKLITKIIFYWSRKNIKQTIDEILQHASRGNDIVVFKKLLDIHTKYNPHTSFDRGAQRIKDLQSFHFFQLLADDVSDSFVYLDFGGANGELTKSLASFLHLKKEQVFVSDVKSWFGTTNIEEYQKHVTLRYLKTAILPFEDNSVDFISAFQVFHHIQHLDIALGEIYRVLKPKGYLLIREHDCDSVITQTLIDLEHSIRELCLNDEKDINLNYLHSYEDTYFSKIDLTNRLISHRFTPIKLQYPEIRGATRFYYQVFQK